MWFGIIILFSTTYTDKDVYYCTKCCSLINLETRMLFGKFIISEKINIYDTKFSTILEKCDFCKNGQNSNELLSRGGSHFFFFPFDAQYLHYDGHVFPMLIFIFLSDKRVAKKFKTFYELNKKKYPNIKKDVYKSRIREYYKNLRMENQSEEFQKFFYDFMTFQRKESK